MAEWVAASFSTAASGSQDGDTSDLGVWVDTNSDVIPGRVAPSTSSTLGWAGFSFVFTIDQDDQSRAIDKPKYRDFQLSLFKISGTTINGMLEVFIVPEYAPAAYSVSEPAGSRGETETDLEGSRYLVGSLGTAAVPYAFDTQAFTINLDGQDDKKKASGAGMGMSDNAFKKFMSSARWNRRLCLSMRWTSATDPTGMVLMSSTNSFTAGHPTLAYETFTAHSGAQGKPLTRRARVIRDQRSGLLVMSDETQWDSWNPGIEVHPDWFEAADTRDYGDTYVVPPSEGVIDNDIQTREGEPRGVK